MQVLSILAGRSLKGHHRYSLLPLGLHLQ